MKTNEQQMNNQTVTPPPTYLSRKNLLPNATFFLISYSHANKDNVYRDLQKLYDEGLNFWYDSNLVAGEIWNEVIKQQLEDERCCGIIFFFEINCLLNEPALDSEKNEIFGRDAVEEEVKTFEKLCETRPDMTAFCVLEKGESVYTIVRDAFVACKDLSDERLKEVLPEERVKTVLTAFQKNKIFISRDEEKTSHIKEILRAVEKNSPRAMSGAKALVEDFVKNSNGRAQFVDGKVNFSFGKYYSDPYEDAFYYSEGEIEELEDGNRVIKRSGKAFITRDLLWELISIGPTEAVLASKKILDYCAGKDIPKWFEIFKEQAFSEEERSRIKSISLPSADTAESVGKMLGYGFQNVTGYAAHIRNSMLVDGLWLEENSGNSRSLICGFKGDQLCSGTDSLYSSFGMVPIIIISLQ